VSGMQRAKLIYVFIRDVMTDEDIGRYRMMCELQTGFAAYIVT
jgi:hypothetical protein